MTGIYSDARATEMSISACTTILHMYPEKGTVLLAVKKRNTSDIIPKTRVETINVAPAFDRITEHPHKSNVEFSFERKGVLHIIESFISAAKSLDIALRILYINYNGGPNEFYANNEESNTACVAIFWNLQNNFKVRSYPIGASVSGLTYEIGKKPVIGFSRVPDIIRKS